jgi:multiple sugar transport system substrate-binding protein
MSTLYSRRNAIKMGLGSLAGLSLAGLAGCDTSSTQPTISTQGPASLQMFFWGSATRDKLTRQAINLFHQSHPDVTITSQYSGNDTYYIKLNAKIASGNTPDLIQMDMRYIAQYVRKGILLDLTELIYNQTIDLSDFDPVLLDSSKVNNAIYGVPLGSNYQCMFCDRSLIDKAGLGLPPQNMTWETFAQYTTQLSRALAAEKIYGTSDYSVNYDAFEVWIRSRGKELYTREGNLAFELADAADWFNYWNTLRKANACLPMGMQASLDLTGTPTDSSVIKGRAAFSHLFTNQYEAFQKASSHPLALVAYPRGSVPGVYLKASQLLSVAANTKYPVQAATFAGFAVTDPGAVKALGLERGVPGSAGGLAMLKPQMTPTQQAIIAFMNQVASTGNARVKEVLDPPGAGQIADVLQRVAQDIGLGKTSVSDGAKTFYQGAQKATS